MPDGSTSVVERIPAVEMAWRDAARHLCEKARLDFETWDFQQSFRGVESYADSSDEDVPRIAEATPTGVGLAEGMLLRTLYRDLEAIQQGTSIQAVVKSVERRGAPLLAVLKDIAKGLAVWRDKVGNRRLSNKGSSALGRWIVTKRRALRGALLGVRQEALRFSVQFSDATLWDRLEAEADGILADARKRAKSREEAIIGEAHEESARIMARTKTEVELEKSRAKDEIKQEIITVAGEMAGRFISDKMDAAKQAELVDEVIREMGEETWQQE